MSETNFSRLQEPSGDGHASPHGFGWKAWQVLKTVQARLRFIAILAAIGLVIGNWSTINNYYEKWTRTTEEDEAAGSGFEYFCPMHPQVVRDTRKEKCPICHMDLSRRARGSGQPEPLPPGTVARVQLTPYRVVLAGVRTSEVEPRPLVREVTTYGSVEFNETRQAHIAATQKGRVVKLYVNYTGQAVEKGQKLALLDVRYSPELTTTLEDLLRARRRGDRDQEQMARKRLRIWDISDQQVEDFLRSGKVDTRLTVYSPLRGHVIKKYQREGNFVEEDAPLYDVDDLETVWVEAQVYEADQALLRVGQKVTATTESLPGQRFEGTLDFIYPHLDESSRTLAVRFHLPNPGHQLRPGMYATVTLSVPADRIDLLAKELASDSERKAQLDRGRVLAVPDSAVIDTGKMKIVYREASEGVYEGVAVQLGPRMAVPGDATAYYPVLGGLREGDKAVTNGGFLIDAETRLNPAAGSVYFGGSGGKAAPSAATVRPSTPVEVSDADRRLIAEQRDCPVTGKPLGSMGTPVKMRVGTETVFLCCQGCEKSARQDPARTLAEVKRLRARATGKGPTHD